MALHAYVALRRRRLGPHLRPDTSAPFKLGPVVLAVELQAVQLARRGATGSEDR